MSQRTEKFGPIPDPALDRQVQEIVSKANTAYAVYPNNAAALAGGLVAGDKYRTGGDPDLVAVVH